MKVNLKVSCVVILVAVMLIAGSSCGNKNVNSEENNSVSSKIVSTEASSETKSEIILSDEKVSSLVPSSEVTADVTVTSQSISSEQIVSEISSSKEMSSVFVSSDNVAANTSSINIPIDVETLDNTKSGWGPGKVTNHCQPPYAVSANQKYKDKYNAFYVGEDCNKVYLTFDEGYENGYTAAILDTLKHKNVKAVFFVTYDYVRRNPKLVQRMIDEGHKVGNHSWSHPSFPSLSTEKAVDEIMKLHNLVKEQFNYEMTLFRFPMGEYSPKALAICKNLGYKSVFWSFAYADWNTSNQPDEAASLEKITSSAHNGAIYLLHAVSKTNTNILGNVIENVRNLGYVWSEFDL